MSRVSRGATTPMTTRSRSPSQQPQLIFAEKEAISSPRCEHRKALFDTRRSATPSRVSSGAVRAEPGGDTARGPFGREIRIENSARGERPNGSFRRH